MGGMEIISQDYYCIPIHIANHPYTKINIECEDFKLLQCFCVVIYDKQAIWNQ